MVVRVFSKDNYVSCEGNNPKQPDSVNISPLTQKPPLRPRVGEEEERKLIEVFEAFKGFTNAELQTAFTCQDTKK